MKITVSNLSKGIKAVNVVKRKIKGIRGGSFKLTMKSSGKANTKKTLSNENTNLEMINFDDYDVEDGELYEYSAVIYSNDGKKYISNKTHTELYRRPSNIVAVALSNKATTDLGSQENDIAPEATTKNVLYLSLIHIS